MKTKLKDLTKVNYNVLKELGLLWEVYPEASGNYEEDCCAASQLEGAPKIWTNWPKTTGQQYIYHVGEMWVGNVDWLDCGDDSKITIWRGGAQYVQWEKNYAGVFWFAPIIWPDPPEISAAS